ISSARSARSRARARSEGSEFVNLLYYRALDEQEADRTGEVRHVLGGAAVGLALHVGGEALAIVPDQLGDAVVRGLLALRHARHEVDRIAAKVLEAVASDRRMCAQPVVGERLGRHAVLPAEPDVNPNHATPPDGFRAW